METLLKIAINELGTEEIVGNEHNPEVLKYANDTDIKGITSDEIPWCSTFVNWVAMKAGLQYSKKANARSWLNVGKKVTVLVNLAPRTLKGIESQGMILLSENPDGSLYFIKPADDAENGSEIN